MIAAKSVRGNTRTEKNFFDKNLNISLEPQETWSLRLLPRA